MAQEIPIVNNSDRQWTVIANLTHENDKNGSFSINRKEIKVNRKSTDNFILSFKPLWVCSLSGKLVLTNQVTNEVYEYELKGFGEEPLAEDHIILNCKARETTTKIFEIKNPTEKPIQYTVWTDLQNAVGQKEFTIKPRDTFKYPLQITPLLGGVYTASITF